MIDLSKVTNKIAAIKALRELPIKIHTQETSPMFHTVSIDLGLREAKELVEAIMAIQPTNISWQIEDMKAEILQLKDKLNKAELDYFHLRSQLVNALDNNPSHSEKDSYDPSF